MAALRGVAGFPAGMAGEIDNALDSVIGDDDKHSISYTTPMQYYFRRCEQMHQGNTAFLNWSNAAWIFPLLILFLAASLPAADSPSESSEEWLRSYTGPTRTDIDATTLDGKVLCGYQGWFNTPGDGSDFGFVHWGQGLDRTNGGRFTVDMWPDVSEYAPEDLFEVPGLKMPDGSPAKLYSAFRKGPVLLHFQWMRQHGIDGVFLSRFIGEAASPRRSRHVNQVLANVREGCHREGRVWAMMLDLSTGRNATTAMVMNDWKFLCDQVKVREDSRYLHHQNKPVVLLWGLGFKDRPWSPEQGEELIQFFKNDPQYGGVYLIGGIDPHWRTLKGESRTNEAWAKVYRMFDSISPWNAGRYRDDASMDRLRKNVWQGDLAELNPLDIGYMPTAFPGFSWDNLRQAAPGSTTIPRRQGEFYWRQFAIFKELGIRTVFVGMFDEVDEGTAIYKVSNTTPVGKHFVTYEGLPSDYYLKLTGAATRMIRGEAPFSKTIPASLTFGTTNTPTASAIRKAPAPLYRDPIHDGAADPTLVWNRAEQCWWMLYTNRRADADEEKGVKWVHGTDIGIASTPDGGLTWQYRGIARGLEFETNGTRNTFWAPEVVDYGGKYHAFISYVRGVPETWAGSRDILHYTSTNLMDWKFESIVVPGSIDACVHRLPDGRWRMWFKNEQKKIRGTVLDSEDLYTWKSTTSEMPDPDPGKGEGPDVFFWKDWFWMVKDMWKGLGVYRSRDLDSWTYMGVILDKPGRRPGDHRIGQHPGVLVQDNDHAYLIYFVHQAEKEPAYRHTWLQVAKLGFDGTTLTCNRDAEFDFRLTKPEPEFTQEYLPTQANWTRGTQRAMQFGTHEIALTGNGAVANPFDTVVTVTFAPPSGLANNVTVRAFFDGGDTWRARLYVSESGPWKWTSTCATDSGLHHQSGAFTAQPSSLRGMLRKHASNPRAWMTDNGQWFANLSDTGYRLFHAKNAPLWREFIRDADAKGITCIRAASLGGWGGTPGARVDDNNTWVWNDPWVGGATPDYTRFDLAKFQTTDERLMWILDHYPEMYLQLILFSFKGYGTEGTGQHWFSLPEKVRANMMNYMLARWSAFPNVFWLLVNDMHCSDKFPKNQAFVREAGQYIAAHDPWNHLLSTGPNRRAGFPFTRSEDLNWCSYIFIEDANAVGADQIQQHQLDRIPLHVWMGEDYYEQDHGYYKDPRYFFRWLFWSWLLSGGSANYGGRWGTIDPYTMTGQTNRPWQGIDGKTIYTGQPLTGLDSVPHIRAYFQERKLDLAQFRPNDLRASDWDGRRGKLRPKAMERGHQEFLIYHPNALADNKAAQVDESKTARIRVDLKDAPGPFHVEWFRACDGITQSSGQVDGSRECDFTAPWKGQDVVLRLYY